MFADLDESLRQMLIRETPLPANEVDIAFERPDRDQTARFSRPTVDLFLFGIDENLDLGETGWEVTRNGNNATLRWPPVRVDVRYLLTVWAQAIDDEHTLLYHVYRTVKRFPELPADLLQGAMARQPRPVYLRVDSGEFSALMDLWNAMDNTVKPALLLRATVCVDLNDVREVPQVRTSGLRIGPMGAPPEMRYNLTGRVRNGEGSPVAGASVRARGRNTPVLSDLEGAYQLTSLADREVEIEVEASGFKTETRSIKLPGDYDFTLSPANDGPPPAPGARPRGRSSRGGGA